MMIRTFRLPLLLLVTSLAAACASHAPPTSRGSSATPGSDTGGRGVYKIGNPYQISGVWYRPAEDYGYDETGIASWYGEDFHGKYTANGEVFDLNGLTAAHRTLPMPTIVQVTNLDNGRALVLRVNDRGPFARGRIIDVSRRAAQLLGFEGPGTAKVRVRVMVPETIQAVALARRNGGGDEPRLVAAEDAPPQAAPREAVTAETLAAPTPPTAPALQLASTESASLPQPGAPAATAPATSASAQPVQVAAAPALTGQVTVLPVQPTQIYIQAGAYARADNALKVKARLDPLGQVKIYGARVNGVDLYRVRLGPIGTVDEADKLLGRVVETGLAEARIVVD